MKKITQWLKKYYFFLLPILPVAIYIVAIWNNNYDTFGDTSVPLNPLNNIEKSIYLWELQDHGVNGWRYMLLLWQLPFYLLSLLGFPPYASIKIYMVSIMVIGIIFSYLFYMTIFKNAKYENKKLGIFCGLIFILSGSTLNLLPTFFFLSALPLCSYLLIKYLDTSKIRYIIFFSLAINYSYLAHLPQAKYLFVLLGELFFILLLYWQIRRARLKNLIFKLIILSIFTFFLNAFSLAPFTYEAFRSGGTYSYYTENVTVYNGDAELNTATLPYITRFFTSSLTSGAGSLAVFLSSPLFTIWTFFLWILAFLAIFFVKNRKEKIIVYLCFFGFVSFMFLAKGPNPPFGEVYKFLLFNVPIFKVFRTTSMSVIGGTIFFAILATMSMYYLRKMWQKILLIIIVIHLIIFSPIYFGVRLITFEEKGQIKKGFSIPNEYYQMGNKLDNIKEDIKILSLPLDDSYTYKDWPYTGQSIMGWITKKPYIHGRVAGYPGFTDNLVLQRMSTKEACYWLAINNIGYILNEKDSRIADYSLSKFNFSGSVVLENEYFKLEKVKPECSLPHIYAATDTFLFKGENNSIPDVSRFIKNKHDVVFNIEAPINRNLHGISQLVIEALPNETSNLSDNSVTKKVFSDLSNLSPLDFLTYSFTLPVEGNYQMIVDDNGQIHKESKILQKGNNTIKIPLSKSKSLIDDDLLNIFINDKTATNFTQLITNWQGDAIYLISLKYKADTASTMQISIEEVKRYFSGRKPSYDLNATLFTQDINHQDAGVFEYQSIVRPDINAQKATVYVKKLLGDVTIQSFDIQEIAVPKVFFTILKDEKKTPPNVIFTKINPTKYNGEVKKAKSPYYLVFSESFSQDWKVYIKTCTVSCNILQEWFLKPIPEERHYMVDGYANAWYIVPSDSDMRASYTVEIEYWPQRLFYIGVIISLLTLIVLLVSFRIKKFI